MNVVIYTKPGCPYCVNAKSLLSAKGIAYSEQKLNEDFTKEFLLETYPSVASFPVVVVDGMNIGGYTELRLFLENKDRITAKLLTEGHTL